MSAAMPVNAAGPRTEIATSLPMPIGDMPAAIAADSPPEDPPGVRSRFQGLLVRPVTRLSVSVHAENSGRLVFARRIPPAALNRATAVASVPGTDGQKMSKSYGNTIEIFGDEKASRKKIMSLVMDSRPPQEPKPDAEKNIAVQMLKLVAPAEVAKDFEERLRAGGLGYGDLKKGLFEHYWNYFAAARARRAELALNLDYVNGVLKEGAAKARGIAQVVLTRARKASGLE